MPLRQLIYASRPFGFEDGPLRQILNSARMHNKRNGITGSLICRSDLYLQLLEGPEREVEETFTRISNDDRHIDIERLVTKPTTDRLFENWAMRHDPAQSWMWTQEEVRAGAVSHATPDEIVSIFKRISEQDGPPPSAQCPMNGKN